MKKIYYTILILLTFFVSSRAQIIFEKTIGGNNTEGVTYVEQTSDGGYIVAGVTTSFGAGSLDAYLLKTDLNGNVIWTKSYGGQNSEQFYFVKQALDGGYLLVGKTKSFGAGSDDILIVKTDSNGDTIWSKTFGTSQAEYAYFAYEESDSTFIVGGLSNFIGSSALIIKISSNGNLIWSKEIASSNGYQAIETLNHDIVQIGQTQRLGTSDLDYGLTKLDSSGTILWTKTYGDTTLDYGGAVVECKDGGFLLGGHSLHSNNQFEVYLIKTNSNGDTLWTRKYSNPNISGNPFSAISKTNDGGFIIGAKNYELGVGGECIFKIDSIGNVQWAKAYGGGPESNIDVHQTTDGGYILAGITYGLTSIGSADVYLVKTNIQGNAVCNFCDIIINSKKQNTLLSTLNSVLTTINFTITSPPLIVSSGGIENNPCFGIGIDPLNINSEISISPNPASGRFNVSFNKIIPNGSLQVLNLLGDKIYERQIVSASQIEVDLKNISSGFYFIKLSDGKKWSTEKLLIQ